MFKKEFQLKIHEILFDFSLVFHKQKKVDYYCQSCNTLERYYSSLSQRKLIVKAVFIEVNFLMQIQQFFFYIFSFEYC